MRFKVNLSQLVGNLNLFWLTCLGPLLQGVVVIVWQLDLQLPVCNQCPSPLKCISLKLAQARCSLIQHCMIKFVSDLQQVCGFLRVLRFPQRYMTEILLNVVVNITPTPKTFKLFSLHNLFTMIVPDECYFRNVFFALNQISTL